MSVPPPLDYASPRPPKPPVSEGKVMLRFLLGLGIGLGISAAVWFIYWKATAGTSRDDHAAITAQLVLCAKFVAGVIFLCLRGWRGLGLGLICSIPLGVLMFVAAICAP